MIRPLAALLAAGLLLGGCATGGDSSRRATEVPRARCLVEPERAATGATTRPLFFFLCIEAP